MYMSREERLASEEIAFEMELMKVKNEMNELMQEYELDDDDSIGRFRDSEIIFYFER